jgi:hypothetical protein
LREHAGENVAKDFAALRPAERYAELEKKLNLAWWMGEDVEIDTPLASERRLAQARLAYAVREAQRMLDAYGAGSLPAVLDVISQQRLRGSEGLFRAIRGVTGEDVQPALHAYDDFENRDAGIQRYQSEFEAAMDAEDSARALTNLLRLYELRGPGNLKYYGQAAYLLQRLGQPAAADRVFLKATAALEARGLAEALLELQQEFVLYALAWDRPTVAAEAAETVLEGKPDYVPALLVRALRLMDEGKSLEAKAAAQRVLELAPADDQTSRDTAQGILAAGEGDAPK